MAGGLRVFDLTPLTRGAAAERRVVVSGVEFRMRHLIVAGVGALAGLLLSLVFWPLLGPTALIWVLVMVGLSLWLVEGRSRQGMGVKNWQSLKNKATNNSGRFFVSGERFDPLANRQVRVQVRCLPVEHAAPSDTDCGMPVVVPNVGDEEW